jgi:hypothetical protein
MLVSGDAGLVAAMNEAESEYVITVALSGSTAISTAAKTDKYSVRERNLILESLLSFGLLSPS